MKKTLTALALIFSAATLPANALTQAEVRECTALHKSISTEQARVQKAVGERDLLAEEAEIAGETWENAEGIRTLSAANAAEADAAKVAYEDAKLAFSAADAAAYDLASAFNSKLTRFNSKCVQS